MIEPKILKLDRGGLPYKWITVEEAIKLYAENDVVWELGLPVCTYRGGVCAVTNARSQITTSSIIATRGREVRYQDLNKTPALDNPTLFGRDKYICAYCSRVFAASQLSREHIKPLSRGGLDNWMNVVTSCKRCNAKKDNLTLDESGMELIYTPYVPNRYEKLILSNRKILVDQMEYLLTQVPKHSRLLLS